VDLLTLVIAIEQNEDTFTAQELLEGIQQHKEELRELQGFWYRLIRELEDLGEI